MSKQTVRHVEFSSTGELLSEKYIEINVPEPEPAQPTESERLATLEEENTLLKAQVSAQSDQMDFYEDCIAEMAAVVYA